MKTLTSIWHSHEHKFQTWFWVLELKSRTLQCGGNAVITVATFSLLQYTIEDAGLRFKVCIKHLIYEMTSGAVRWLKHRSTKNRKLVTRLPVTVYTVCWVVFPGHYVLLALNWIPAWSCVLQHGDLFAVTNMFDRMSEHDADKSKQLVGFQRVE